MTDPQLSREAPPANHYDSLDPGIRDTVHRLNDAGFVTTDSGDGVTKIADGWAPYDEALPYPHVFCRVDTFALITEANRLQDVLGVEWTIQANYDPRDGKAFLVASQPVAAPVATPTKPRDTYDDLLVDWRAQDLALQEIYGLCGTDEGVTCPADVVAYVKKYLRAAPVATEPAKSCCEQLTTHYVQGADAGHTVGRATFDACPHPDCVAARAATEEQALIQGLEDVKAGRIVPLPAPSGPSRLPNTEEEERSDARGQGATIRGTGSTASSNELSPSLTECEGCGCSRWACEAYRTAGKVCCPDCDHGKTRTPTDWREIKRQMRRRVARQAGILADVVVNRKTITQSQKDEVVALLRACEKELIDAS